MKKIIPIILTFIMIISVAGCSSGNNVTGADSSKTDTSENDTSVTPEKSPQEDLSDEKKILVAFFSQTGNTKRISETISYVTGADTFQITPAVPYTEEDLNHNNKDSRTSKEMSDSDCRPEITGQVEHMEEYDMVFIGYPIWWGDTPRVVSTFVESYDLSGKTIITYCTSGGSELNDSSIKGLVDGAEWITGTRIEKDATRADIIEWITDLGKGIKIVNS